MSEDLFLPIVSHNRLEFNYKLDNQLSDVLFIIEGKPLPSHKTILSERNNVFKAMFSGNFKESKDNEVVIEDTTFDAFKTLCFFLYYNQLVLKDDNDLDLIEEVYKLADRYQTPELMDKIKDHLFAISVTFENMASISRIAFNYQMEALIEVISIFFDNNLDYFVNKFMNKLEDKNLIKVLAINYRNMGKKLIDTNNRLNRIDRSLTGNGSLFIRD